jgi:hypothetical protein
MGLLLGAPIIDDLLVRLADVIHDRIVENDDIQPSCSNDNVCLIVTN